MIIFHTNHGPITVTLDREKAPHTVENFLAHVNQDFYEHTLFHRVIDGFMIQGGGFKQGMVEKDRLMPPIRNEAKTGLSNKTGTLAMARTHDPHSASAQFFINLKDNPFLDHRSETTEGWGYCAFGQVTAGMDIVFKIAKMATTSRRGHDDVPIEDILIERIEIIDTP